MKDVVRAFDPNDPHDPKRTGLIRFARALPFLGWVLPLLGLAPNPVEGVGTALRGPNPWFGLRYARIGRWRLVGLPTEPSVGLGDALREAVTDHDPEADAVVVLGLVGGFHGYASTPREYRVQDYEGSSNLWGRGFGAWITERVGRMAAAPRTRFAESEMRAATAVFTPLDPRRTVDLPPPRRPRRRFQGQSYRRIWWQHEDDGLRLAGTWLAPHVEGDPARALADGRPVLTLVLDGVPWAPSGRGPIDDTRVPFLLERRLADDGPHVVWSWEVFLVGADHAVPDGLDVAITDAPPFAEMPGSQRLRSGWIG